MNTKQNFFDYLNNFPESEDDGRITTVHTLLRIERTGKLYKSTIDTDT